MSKLSEKYSDAITFRRFGRKWSTYVVARYRSVQAKDGHMYWKLVGDLSKPERGVYPVTQRAKEIARELGLPYSDSLRQYDDCDRTKFLPA